MAVIALISAKGSPGVSTTSLAMTLAWPRPVLLVEADPAGGDIMAGYVRGQVPMDRGLVQVALSARHNRLAADFPGQLLDLAKPKSAVSRVLLAGLADPAQAATVAPVWDRLAAHFAHLGHSDTGTDVIIDCGRLSTMFAPLPLIASADIVLLVVRATLRSAATAKPAIAAAHHGLGTAGKDRLALVVIEGGEYRAAELGKALRTPVLAAIPWRPSEAAALSDGVGRLAGSSALVRAVREMEPAIRTKVAQLELAAAPSAIERPPAHRALAQQNGQPHTQQPGQPTGQPGNGVPVATNGQRPAIAGVQR